MTTTPNPLADTDRLKRGDGEDLTAPAAAAWLSNPDSATIGQLGFWEELSQFRKQLEVELERGEELPRPGDGEAKP